MASRVSRVALLLPLLPVGGGAIGLAVHTPPKPTTDAELRAEIFEQRLKNCSVLSTLQEVRATLDRFPWSSDETAGGVSAEHVMPCRPANIMWPIRLRKDLGPEMKRLGLNGVAVEVGARIGAVGKELLEGWQQASLLVQVDEWATQRESDNTSTLNWREMLEACNAATEMQARGFAKAVSQCQGSSLACVELFDDNSVDFVWLNKHHDRTGLINDLVAYWPKVKHGGIIAGYGYAEQDEPGSAADPANLNLDWTKQADGSPEDPRENPADAVLASKGAVDDFFRGVGFHTPPDLRRCPRQPIITYREGRSKMNSWIVRK